ncbi:MAG: nitrilase-related carbon-nitrogen hydrolase [Armatimonadota bacterium]|nr:nitrilase-related carbon-nitrogen hydrolase [Armatimonadota bacterium]
MKIRVVAVQFKPRKGDVEHNLDRIADTLRQIVEEGVPADVVVFPETITSGYFLEGGVREAARTREQILHALAQRYRPFARWEPLDVVLGFYELWQGKYYNSALYLTLHPEPESCRIVHTHRKFFLPTYGVFQEKRFVARGRNIEVFPTRFGPATILICEDVWHSITGTIAALKGAEVFYVIAASPGRGFHGENIDNVAKWQQLLCNMAEEHGVWVVNASLVGFEGGKGFVGRSMVVNPFGQVVVSAPLMREAMVTATIDTEEIAIARANAPLLADLEAGLADLLIEMQEIAAEQHARYRQ